MSNIFSMKGRIGRIEFLVIQILTMVCIVGSILLGIQISKADVAWGSYLLLILVFVICYASLCCTIKRAHDLYPAVNPWLLFIPVYNINIFLILLLTPGKKGLNQYGLSPYARKRKNRLDKTETTE